jgi:hypothetical protein
MEHEEVKNVCGGVDAHFVDVSFKDTSRSLMDLIKLLTSSSLLYGDADQ